jgi:hypothetical protein
MSFDLETQPLPILRQCDGQRTSFRVTGDQEMIVNAESRRQRCWRRVTASEMAALSAGHQVRGAACLSRTMNCGSSE